MLRPSVQPNCCNPCKNAALRAWPSGSSHPVPAVSTPMRRILSPCCARGERPRGRHRRAAEKCDELSPPHRFPLRRREQLTTSQKQCVVCIAENPLTEVAFGSKGEILGKSR